MKCPRAALCDLLGACMASCSPPLHSWSLQHCSWNLAAAKGLPPILLAQCLESMLHSSQVGELCICTLSIQMRLALRRAQNVFRTQGLLMCDEYYSAPNPSMCVHSAAESGAQWRQQNRSST